MDALVLQQALHFLNEEKQFHLGMMPTEQSHPLTESLSSTMKADTQKGLKMLFSVDALLPDRLQEVLASEAFEKLVASLVRALRTGHNILFSGCGATGRLSLILEAAWREFWQTRPAEQQALYADRVRGMITGGDRALVQSVEGFEDYISFGRRQLRDDGIQAGDVVVAVSEGGETSSVIGSAWEALDLGADVFFAFNNPPELLCQHIERSRALIEDSRVTVLDLCTGPMALAGSTRMQAVTMELMALGIALETAMERILNPHAAGDHRFQIDTFHQLIDALNSSANLAALAALVEQEEQCYRAKGRVTYITDHLLLDIMQDTTERTPTFTLPPFRSLNTPTAAPSWAFLKHPGLPTKDAWRTALGHEPRGIEWTPTDYRSLGAAEDICLNPPLLSASDLHAYEIGNEPDLSRQSVEPSLAILVDVARSAQPISETFQQYLNGFSARHTIALLSDDAPARSSDSTVIRCPMPTSPLRLWERLALKLVFNTMSTATMVRMDYVAGNWMSRAEASNKKLVDRGIRLVAQLGGISYEDACIELHRTLALLKTMPKELRSATAPAIATLERLSLERTRKTS